MATANLTSIKPNRLDLQGARIGFLIVFRDVGADDAGHRFWLCQCTACGGEYRTRAGYLTRAQRRGSMASCGCQKSKSVSTHGLSKHPAYLSWLKMIARCTDPKTEQFAYYGGRGIEVCDHWRRFENFWSDMGGSWAAGLTLERNDVNGNYSADNCRWATIREQANNKRSNRFLDTPVGRMTLAQAAEHFGVDRNTITQRIDALGWSVLEAVTRPKRVVRKHDHRGHASIKA